MMMAPGQKRSGKDAPGRDPDRVRFNVKLVTGVSPQGTLNKTRGILRADPLFPEETDEELSTIYVVEIEAKDVTTTVKRLEKDPHVEYVERPAARKLVQ